MRPEDGADPADGADAHPALPGLERRARELGADAQSEPLVQARRVAALERDLLALRRELVAGDPDLADDRGHPVLSETVQWEQRAERLGLDAPRQRARRLADAFVEDEAARWREAAAHEDVARDPALCFERLSEATELDREALAREDVHFDAPPLAGEREALRETFLRALDVLPPDDGLRHAWAVDLLDRADVVLTSLDDLTPERAALHLEVAVDDVAWHLRHVERAHGPDRRRLRRKLRRLRAEVQERRLQDRLEGRFGPANVGRWERLIFWLILLVLGLLVADAVTDPPEGVVVAMILADTLACVVFLWDFFFRLALVRGRTSWFLRHALVDFIPSIPFGILVLATGAHKALDLNRAGRAVRLVRVARVARSVRVVMPLVRLVRAFGFLTRGFDRLVRRYGYALNRDLILYPTRAERARARAAEEGTAPRLRRLQGEVADLWTDLLRTAPAHAQSDVLDARTEALEASRAQGLTRRVTGRGPSAPLRREVTGEALLRRLGRVTPEGLEASMGPDFTARAARAVRLLSRAPLRWLPPFSSYVPRLGPAVPDAEVTAAGAHRVAARLERVHGRWFWFADLYGTITPAEFVDRVGSALVKGAARPAYRLALLGGVLLLTELVLYVSRLGLFIWLADKLGSIVGTTLIVLGSVCIVVLALGWWLKRLAREATSFYERTAAAQYLPLLESVKGRFLERDAGIVARRVLAPEVLLGGGDADARLPRLEERFARGVRAWLLEAQAGGDAAGAFDAMERTVLLYRDGLDGALLGESDTRTTNQLLGNPALRFLRRSAQCVNRQEQKTLRALDLERQTGLFGGPYFWFSLISRAVAQSAARLIVEYNRYAIPLVELPLVTQEERRRHEAWLQGREDVDADAPPAAALAADPRYVTTAFTALHFLDDDAARDEEVERRFGPRVLENLQRDRRALFRRIFGTFPLHNQPKERRVVNLYRLYEDWFAGGRALLLPLRALWGALRRLGAILGGVVRAVREIRRPPLRRHIERDAEADFLTAARKIDRMRGPVVRACLWLRARMDPEYLGVELPRTPRPDLDGGTAREDLEFLGASAALRRQVEEERDQAQADMRRLDLLLDEGLLERLAARLEVPPDALGPEHRRAAAFAYRADLEGVRSLLSAPQVLRECFATAAQREILPNRWFRPRGLKRAFRDWWRTHGRGGRFARRAAWRMALNDVHGAGRALQAWGRHPPAEAREEGVRRLADVLRHPGRASEQLVTLRAVQTLALVDVLNYRAHVWRLGRYGEDGDDPRHLLALGGVDAAADGAAAPSG